MPLRHAKEVWKDQVDRQNAEQKQQADKLEELIQEFLETLSIRIEEISATRLDQFDVEVLMTCRHDSFKRPEAVAEDIMNRLKTLGYTSEVYCRNSSDVYIHVFWSRTSWDPNLTEKIDD